MKKKPEHSHVEATLDEQTLHQLERNGSMTVQDLHQALASGNPALTRSEMTDTLWRLVDADKLTLEDVPPHVKSLSQYVKLWERNLWLYSSLLISVATVLAVYVLPEDYPLVIIRWILGSMFVLVIPGYVMVEALFPRGPELDGIERAALSIGLSLVLTPLVGLLLNFTPWGIRITPIMISLTILSIVLCAIALVRKYKAIP